MKKIKNEAALLKTAMVVAERYAVKRGYKPFSATDSAKHKVESLYRLLVHDKLLTPLPENKEDLASLKHRLVMWIIKQLPADHELLKWTLSTALKVFNSAAQWSQMKSIELPKEPLHYWWYL